MISALPESSALAAFDPLVIEWFTSASRRATEPQISGWPEIHAGRDVLISAPTGSGKTLAAFLICLDRLVRRGSNRRTAECDRGGLCLAAQSAEQRHSQESGDAAGRDCRSSRRGEASRWQPIRTAVRTGDTPAAERQQMGKHPPHILVTTPESLYILLTAEKSRAMLRTMRTVIVDEIHAVADDKRGSHLALSLARLEP